MASARGRITDVEDYIAGHKPVVQERLRELRALVRAGAPHLQESMRRDVPTYHAEGVDRMWLRGYADHATLGFFAGASLADEARLLEGWGRERHVKLFARTALDRDAVQGLVKASAAPRSAHVHPSRVAAAPG
ncbi:MAG: DUF1801 domain-containing protein [bacterium]